jgi:hypothetical protein
MAGMMQPPRIVRTTSLFEVAEARLNANLKTLGLGVDLSPSSSFFTLRLMQVLDHLVALEVERQKAGK